MWLWMEVAMMMEISQIREAHRESWYTIGDDAILTIFFFGVSAGALASVSLVKLLLVFMRT